MGKLHEKVAIKPIKTGSIRKTRIQFSQWMKLVAERCGSMATFRTCSAAGMDLDGLLRFLEDRDKVRITSGVAFPGGSAACEH